MEYTKMTLIVWVALWMCMVQRGITQQRVGVGGVFGLSRVRQAFHYETTRSGQTGNVRLTPNTQLTKVQDSYSLFNAICSVMPENSHSMVGGHTLSSLPMARSIVSKLHMPYITTSGADNDGSYKGYVFFMQPLYAKAIVDYINHHMWSKVHYIYDSPEGYLHLLQLYDSVTADGIQIRDISIHRVQDAIGAHQILQRASDNCLNCALNVVLDMKPKQAEILFNYTFTPGTSFLLTSLGISDFNFTNNEYTSGHTVVGFRLVDPEAKRAKDFFQEWSSLYASVKEEEPYHHIDNEAALAADAARLMHTALAKMVQNDADFVRALQTEGDKRNATSYLDCRVESISNKHPGPITPWQFGQPLADIIRKTKFSGLSGRVEFDEYGLRKNYKLDIVEVSLSGLEAQKIQNKIGTWQSTGGLVPDRQPQQPGLLGFGPNRTLIVTSILTPPYLMLRSTSEYGAPLVGNDRFEGYCADLAHKLATLVGFKYVIRPVADGKYGSVTENGSWNGMIGELVSGYADLAIAPLTITAVRSRVVDFSPAFISGGIGIMAKKPVKRIPSVFSFLKPFPYELWLAILIAFIASSLVLFLVSRFSQSEWTTVDSPDGPQKVNYYSLGNSLWSCFGALMWQGYQVYPKSLGGRTVSAVWWMVSVFFCTAYVAESFKFLAKPGLSASVDSIIDLAGQTNIKYGVIAGGSTENFFRTSKASVYERMWTYMQYAKPSVMVRSNEEGIKRVRTSYGDYVFMTDTPTIEYINQQRPCDTYKVGNSITARGYGVATPLGSPLRAIIKLAMLEMRENGELQKLQMKWFYDKGECGKYRWSKVDSRGYRLNFRYLAGLFYILMVGLGIALVVAVLEFIIGSIVKAKKRQMSLLKAMQSNAVCLTKTEPDPELESEGPELEPTPGPSSLPNEIGADFK